MFCNNCGSEVPFETGVCPYCGAPLMVPKSRKKGIGRVSTGSGAAHAAAAGGGMLKSLLIALAVAVAVTISVVVVVPKAIPPKPEDTVEKMETALNKMDIKGLLKCFDQQSQDLYGSMSDVTGKIIDSALGFSLGNYTNLTSGLGGLVAGSGKAPKFDLTVNNVTYSDDKNCVVDVTCTVDFTGSIYEDLGEESMGTQTEEFQLPMTYEDGSWKVSISAASLLEGQE